MTGGAAEKMGVEKRRGSVSAHPDGRQIAFSVREESPNEVWVMENFLPALKPVR